MNAFTEVRPRGPNIDIPATPPRKTNDSRAPMAGPIRALDRNGRATVALPPRVLGAISIQNRDDGLVSQIRNDSIKRGSSI